MQGNKTGGGPIQKDKADHCGLSKVFGIDICPHMSPDDVPENVNLEVSRVSSCPNCPCQTPPIRYGLFFFFFSCPAPCHAGRCQSADAMRINLQAVADTSLSRWTISTDRLPSRQSTSTLSIRGSLRQAFTESDGRHISVISRGLVIAALPISYYLTLFASSTNLH